MSISINDYQQPQLKLIPEDRRFIELINNRITMYGQIPYTVPEKLVIELIKESALYFFRMGYWRSQQVVFYRIEKKDIIEFMSNYEKPKENQVDPGTINPMYKNLRGTAIKLPPFVNAVREIFESNQQNNTTQEIFDSTSDLLFRQQMSPYGYSLMGINSNMYIYEVTTKLTEQAAWHATMSTSVPFRYNNATHTLILNYDMKEETQSLMIQCDCNVDLQVLYLDDLFIQYVYSRCKQELRRVLAGHTFMLPGDVTMNADDICSNADTEISEIKDVLKGSTGIGDLILQR